MHDSAFAWRGETEIGFRTPELHVTGDPAATKAIVHVYDLFDYCPQTLQGSDIVVTQGREPYLIFVPDFISPERPGKHEWFLPGADKTVFNELIEAITSDSMMTLIYDTVSALRSDGRYIHVKRWGGVRFCWGSKGVSIICSKGDESLLDVAAHTSPSRLNPEIAKTITVTTLVLPSKGEAESLADSYVGYLKGEKGMVRFDEVHGCMSARYADTVFRFMTFLMLHPD